MTDEPVRWAEIAVKAGRTMHRLVQFHAINRSPLSGSAVAVEPPTRGNMPSDLLKVACAALAEHTGTPDYCWFCLWDGYGWLHDTGTSHVEFRPTGMFAAPVSTVNETSASASLSALAVLNAPYLRLPHRDYLLFEGPLDAANELGWNMPGGGFVPQSPNLFWPDDHAWCVASEIDLFCTLVAGSNALAESLMADPRLEVWRVFPDDPITLDSDDQNT
jgi:hypothetical protein